MKYFGLSNKGILRKSNQDRYTIIADKNTDMLLAAVCDGMGGANGGEIASSIAISTIESCFADYCNKNTKQHAKLGTFLSETASNANKCIFQTALRNPTLDGMGTTFVGMVANGNKVTIANIGDSRAYLICEDEIKQLTQDHSLVREMIQHGHISLAEAMVHPSKNVITRALGVDSRVECDTYTVDVNKGQYILLCSDGLTEEVSEPEIHFEVCNSDSVENACKSLIDIANARGGHDNITVVICAF